MTKWGVFVLKLIYKKFMKFKTTTITGKGRGKNLGFPTINMIIPEEIPVVLRQGVYAAKIYLNNEKYYGALYYGPSPTFNDQDLNLEVYLFDTVNFYVGAGEEIEIETVKFVREVMKFDLPELLVRQMQKDTAYIREILHLE